MAKVPEDPSIAPYVMSALGILLSLLSGATIYFLKRLIDRNDKDHESFSSTLSTVKAELIKLENRKSEFNIGGGIDNTSLLENITKIEKMSESLGRAFIAASKTSETYKEEVRKEFITLKVGMNEIKKQVSDIDSHSVKMSAIMQNNAIDKDKMVEIQKSQLENKLLMEKAHQLLRVFTEEVIKLKQKVK